ncbi:hypothetical protein VTG60DRAFT_6466 [Thermothelomyces hinnuleus]
MPRHFIAEPLRIGIDLKRSVRQAWGGRSFSVRHSGRLQGHRCLAHLARKAQEWREPDESMPQVNSCLFNCETIKGLSCHRGASPLGTLDRRSLRFNQQVHRLQRCSFAPHASHKHGIAISTASCKVRELPQQLKDCLRQSRLATPHNHFPYPFEWLEAWMQSQPFETRAIPEQNDELETYRIWTCRNL